MYRSRAELVLLGASIRLAAHGCRTRTSCADSGSAAASGHAMTGRFRNTIWRSCVAPVANPASHRAR